MSASIPRERFVAATIAVGLQAGLLYLLVAGLSVPLPAIVDDGLKLFALAPPAPPPPAPRPVPPPVRNHRAEGAAAPVNLRSRATPVVAPTPVIVVPLPPPVIAAPVAGVGGDPFAGNGDRRGPGTGSGGQGTGTGQGGSGNGDGGGGDETPPRWRKGRIKNSDYPRAAAEAGAQGSVSVRYRVETDGRVTGCVITRSSGNAELDETTCRLIEQRFRYDPSRDAEGRPVVSWIVRDNDWIIERFVAPATPPR